MSRTSPQNAALPFPYGRPLSEVSSRPYKSAGSAFPHSSGYVMEIRWAHPAANQRGYVLQHRLVAEQVLGRYLMGVEVVHHEDEDGMNNDPSNLWVFPSQSHHMRHHKRLEKRHQKELADRLRPLAADPTVSLGGAAEALGCSATTVQAMLKEHQIQWTSAAEHQLDEELVRKALQGRTTLAAAEALGVHHMTLRNRFDHLLAKRATPGFLEAHREEIRSRAKQERTEDLCTRFGCHQTTLTAQIARWSKEEPDAWSDVLAFRRSRLGLGRPPRRKV